jgi:hypothetical protein
MTDENCEIRGTHVNLARIPKVEMHLHLEGAMRPETYVELRRRDEPGYRLEQSLWHEKGYRFDGLNHFLDTAGTPAGDFRRLKVGGGIRMSREHLPTRQQINVHGSLDEGAACRRFPGKDLDEVERGFQENSAYYQEDLMWMGPVAFRFYVEAAVRYLLSAAADKDADMVNCFAGLLEFRLEHEPEEVASVAGRLAVACRFILEHWERFDIAPEIYVGLRGRYVVLERTLVRLVGETMQGA